MIAGAIDTWLRRKAAEEVLSAYFAWWQACIAVRDAYRDWANAPRADAGPAFRGYAAALERESHAAETYAAHATRLHGVAWAQPA